MSSRMPTLDIPRGGLNWSGEVIDFGRTGRWSATFLKLLRVGTQDEHVPPLALVAEAERARAECLAARARGEDWFEPSWTRKPASEAAE